MSESSKHIDEAYNSARQQYADWGVDADRAIERLSGIAVSLHCWQGDDVGGFENAGEELGGGLAVTGNYPGKARTANELRGDLDKALSLIPGKHRFNLHACYAETGGKRVERNELRPEHFQNWIDWARRKAWAWISIRPFSPIPRRPTASRWPTPTRASGSSGSNTASPAARSARRSARHWNRRASPTSGSPTGSRIRPWTARARGSAWPNRWTRSSPSRSIRDCNLDAVESKLFGIGSESYVVGSHEFYLGYAVTRRKLLCLDTGHFHPTEMIFG